MLHFHGFDYSEPLPKNNALANRGENSEDTTMHRRLDDIVAAGSLHTACGKIFDADARLAPGAQDESVLRREKNAAVGGWSDAGNRKRRAIFAITDASFCVLAIDHERQRDIPRAAELKTITCRPRRIVFGSGILGRGCRVLGPTSLKQRCGPESSGCAIRLARYRAQCSKTAIDKSGIDLAVAKRRGTAQARQKGHIGTNPGNCRGIEAFGKTLKRGSTGRCARDEFGNHWIVKRRHRIAAFDPAIDPDSARPAHGHNLSGRRQKAVLRIFGIDPRLDGVSVEADIVLTQRQLFTRGDTELPFNEIKTRSLLGHRMLDLQTRVHFDEPERFAAQSARTIGDEFDSAGTAISDRFRRSHGGVADLIAKRLGHARRRRLLDHLLVTPLERAIALAEMDDVAMSVGKYLAFDVPRRGNEFLYQAPPGAESRLALAGRRFESRIKVGVFVDATQATTAAAGCRLDENRIADLVGLLAQEFGVLALAVIAGHDRNTGLLHEALALVLKPHGPANARPSAAT